MVTYIVRRFLLLIPTLIAISLISFGLIHLAPGDPALVILRAGGVQQISEENLAQVREEMGLDDPFLVQYGRWVWRTLQFDLGTSVRTGAPVAELILARLPATLQLAGVSLVLALLISVPVGIVTAVKQHTFIDHGGRIFAFLGASMPSFWLALLLIFLFAVKLGWLPALGYGELRHLVLPALVLSLGIAPVYARLLRSSMIEVLSKPYVVAARAKGVREQVVIMHHALRNALIPFVTVFGISLAHLLGGAVVIETIFAWPGVGKLIVDAILARDFPIVQAFVVIAAATFVLINLTVDLSYRFLDPRIRLEGSKS
jgi:peptide/nickel transport system permease protein